jgi:hypothetical protein
MRGTSLPIFPVKHCGGLRWAKRKPGISSIWSGRSQLAPGWAGISFKGTSTEPAA